MILGHDFKYCIPEMDRLIGAAMDMGIRFNRNSESISYPEGRKFLVQIVRGEHNNAELQLMVTTHEINKREVIKI